MRADRTPCAATSRTCSGRLLYVVSEVKETVNEGVPVFESRDGESYDRAVPRGGTALLVANIEYRRGFRVLSEKPAGCGVRGHGQCVGRRTRPVPGWRRARDARHGSSHPDSARTISRGRRVSALPTPCRSRPLRSRGTRGTPGQIFCASPGNTVSIDPENPGSIYRLPSRPFVHRADAACWGDSRFISASGRRSDVGPTASLLVGGRHHRFRRRRLGD